MRYDTHHKQDTLKRILNEASQAFRLHGPEGVSVQTIMRSVGLTHGGFYAHFTSKDDLLLQAVENMFDEALMRWQTATENCPPAQGLLNYINLYLAQRHVDSPHNGCPIPALGCRQWRLPTPVREVFTTGIQRLRSAIGDHLDNMGYVDSTILASSVLNELVGAILIARSAVDQEEMNRTLDASRMHLKARLGL